jgi:hypothetical protein
MEMDTSPQGQKRPQSEKSSEGDEPATKGHKRAQTTRSREEATPQSQKRAQKLRSNSDEDTSPRSLKKQHSSKHKTGDSSNSQKNKQQKNSKEGGSSTKEGKGSKDGRSSKDPTSDNMEEQDTTPENQNWWLGFDTMEKKALSDKIPECFTPEPISKLMKKGFSEMEAEELLDAVHSYPHVPQILYPIARPDGLDGQHYNLTQLPFDIATDPETGLSLDYQVAIHFNRPTKQFTHGEILGMTQERLREMKIPLGAKIAEPITILCVNGSARHWSGTIKLHLRHPDIDGINMLSGVRPFILKLDNDTPTLGKVCKGYNAVARNNLLSVKIASPSLANVEGHELHLEVLIDGFKRKHDYEITNVQKNFADTWAWLLAPTPQQVEKLVKYYVPFRNELIHTIVKKGEKLSTSQLAKKNCLMLILHNLQLTKNADETLHKIKELMGDKNVTSHYFSKLKGKLHTGSVNIECLNPTVYHQYVNKTFKIFDQHVSFTPHPRSLAGSMPPSKEEKEKLGFCDINTAMANTLAAIQNAPASKDALGKEEIIAIVGDAVTKGNRKLKTEIQGEMKTMKNNIIKETSEYALTLNENLQAVVAQQMHEFSIGISKALATHPRPPTLALPPPPGKEQGTTTPQ